MGNPKGGIWERALLVHFRGMGMLAERLRLAGKLDEGDLVVDDGGPDALKYIIEAKNTARIDLASYVGQAITERDNYCKARGLDPATVMPLAIIKRRGKSTQDAYVVTSLKEFFDA